MDKKYTLRYLPQFEYDSGAARDHIAFKLQNPVAALRLVEKTEEAIFERLKNPSITQPYPSVRKRKHPYYRINVKNYSVFYVVIGNVMEVRRFIYSRRNIPEILQ